MGRKTKYQEQMKMENQKALENIAAFYSDEISRINTMYQNIDKGLKKTAWITLFNKPMQIHYLYIGIAVLSFVMAGFLDNWKYALPGMIWIPARMIVGLFLHIWTGNYWKKRTGLILQMEKKFQALTGMAANQREINDLFYP